MVKNEKQLRLVADLIAAQFGPGTEVVVHDFTADIDHTIVYIVNGHVTGRRIGDGPTHAFLRYMKHQGASLDKIRYVTHTADGRMIRSSTMNFFDEDGLLNSAMCINQDITDLVALENAVKGMSSNSYFETNQLSTDNDFDTPSPSIHGLMDSLIAEGLALIGLPPDKMNKEAKIRLIRFLDERGVFMIQKSGQAVCELLGISKFTLYNYLEEARGKKE